MTCSSVSRTKWCFPKIKNILLSMQFYFHSSFIPGTLNWGPSFLCFPIAPSIFQCFSDSADFLKRPVAILRLPLPFEISAKWRAAHQLTLKPFCKLQHQLVNFPSVFIPPENHLSNEWKWRYGNRHPSQLQLNWSPHCTEAKHDKATTLMTEMFI